MFIFTPIIMYVSEFPRGLGHCDNHGVAAIPKDKDREMIGKIQNLEGKIKSTQDASALARLGQPFFQGIGCNGNRMV